MLNPEKIKTLITHKLKEPMLLIWAGAFMDILGFALLIPYLAPVFLDFGVPVAQVGIFLSINVFFGFFSGILWGALSDRYGRRPILIICRIGTLVGYVLLAFSTNLTMIVISRVIDGIFSRNVQIVLTIVGDRTAPDRRSEEMSKAGIAWLTGSLIGPGIGALLIQFGIIGIGIFNSALALVTLLMTIFTLKESNPVVLEGKTTGERVSDPLKPIISFRLLKKPLPRLRLAQILFNSLSMFIFRISISLFVTVRFGFSVGQIGFLLTATGIVSLLIRLLIFPSVLRKLGDAKTLMLGFLFYLVGFIWLIFLGSIWQYTLVIILISFGTMCSVDILFGIMSQEVRKEEIGEMIGLAGAVDSIALFIGPIIGSTLIALSNPAYYGLAATAIAAVPIVLAVTSKIKVQPAIQPHMTTTPTTEEPLP
jgi:MFS transporter, DHA1 family, tetracycline resistance protein